MENNLTKARRGLAQGVKELQPVAHPLEHLRRNVVEVRALNQEEGEALVNRVGKRYRDTLHQFAVLYPHEVPAALHLGEGLVVQPHTMTGYSKHTFEEVHLSPAFWAQHGYDLIQRVLLGNEGRRNEEANI